MPSFSLQISEQRNACTLSLVWSSYGLPDCVRGKEALMDLSFPDPATSTSMIHRRQRASPGTDPEVNASWGRDQEAPFAVT